MVAINMSNLVQNDEKIASTSSLLSSASDRRQWAAILGQRQLENLGGADGGPPRASATAAGTSTTLLGGFSENTDRDAAINARALLCESERSRRAEESSRTGAIGSSKNQQRFENVYDKYYSGLDVDDEVAAVEKALFSKPIIAVEKSTKTSRGVQRPEKCKEYQRRCSSAGNFASSRPFAVSTSSGLVSSTYGSENSAMPAAVTCSSMDPGAASKLASLNANFSLPPSPQRSSSSSTSDGGASAFLAMAKRLHRLRVAAASPNRNINPDTLMASKDSVRDEEFVSIEPLASKSNLETPVGELGKDIQMPQIPTAVNLDSDRLTVTVEQRLHSETPSTAPSLSDVSIASFYRLPPAQTLTSDTIGFQRQMSSSSLGKSKVWSSEPVLLSSDHRVATGASADGQQALLDNDYREKHGLSFLANIDGRQGSHQEG